MTRLDDFSGFTPEQRERLRALIRSEQRKTRNVMLVCVAVLLGSAVAWLLLRWWLG